MGLGTEEQKKTNIIQDKNGLWWSAGDIDNMHDKLHELLQEKAQVDPRIAQCPFCVKKFKKKVGRPQKVFPDTPMNMNITGHLGGGE